ncbi:MAG: hypothetical protein Q8O89_02180 [Nanoarchaeota archaeon]|nr:hypothetical protein [Nanoarchaeota archaeon]
MKRIIFTILAMVVLLIAGCGSANLTTTQQTNPPANQQSSCVAWDTVTQKVKSSSDLMASKGAIMNSPTCENVEEAISANMELEKLQTWFASNLCQIGCNDDKPNKQAICNNVNIQNTLEKRAVLQTFQANCNK